MHTEALAESIPCPEPACPHMATIIDHWSWPSTKGPVEHVKTRCPNGHVFTPNHRLAAGQAPAARHPGPRPCPRRVGRCPGVADICGLEITTTSQEDRRTLMPRFLDHHPTIPVSRRWLR
jgi:hypothetical protein